MDWVGIVRSATCSIVFLLTFQIGFSAGDDLKVAQLVLSPDKLDVGTHSGLRVLHTDGASVGEHAVNFLEEMSALLETGGEIDLSKLNKLDWVLLFCLHTSYECGSLQGAEEFALELLDRPSLQRTKLSLSVKFPISPAGEHLYKSKLKKLSKSISEMPFESLQGIVAAAASLEIPQLKESKFLQALMVNVSHELIARENGNLPSDSNDWSVEALEPNSSCRDELGLLLDKWIALRDELKVIPLVSRNTLDGQLYKEGFQNLFSIIAALDLIEGNYRTIERSHASLAAFQNAYPKEPFLQDWLKAASRAMPAMEVDAFGAIIDSEEGENRFSIDFMAIVALGYLDSLETVKQNVVTHNYQNIEWDSIRDEQLPRIYRPNLVESVDGLVGPSSLSKKDLDRLYSILDYFYYNSRRCEVFRHNQVLHKKALFYSFAHFVSECRRLNFAQRKEYAKFLERFNRFSSNASGLEKSIFLAHMQWTRLFWDQRVWDDASGIIRGAGQGFVLSQDERSYLREHVTPISTICKRLTMPFDFSPSEFDANVPALSSDSLIYKMLTEDGQFMGEGLRLTLCDLFKTAYDGKFILEKTRTGSGAGDGTGDADEIKSITLSFPAIKDASSITLENAVARFSGDPVQNGRRTLGAIFRTESSRYSPDSDALKQLRAVTPVEYRESLYQFYERPKVIVEKKVSGGLQRVRKEPGYLNRFGGKLTIEWKDSRERYLFEEPVRSLIQLSIAKQQIEKGLRFHRSVGFQFEPDIRTGEWLDKDVAKGNLIKAREHYLIATTFYKGLTDERTMESANIFGGVDAAYRLGNFVDYEDPDLPYRSKHPEIVCGTPLAVIGDDDGSASWAALGIAKGLSKADALVKRVDAGQDAFGFSGAVQMVAGVEELYNKLEFFAASLKNAKIDVPVSIVQQTLTLQREEFAKNSMHERVYARAFELGAIEQQLIGAELAVEKAQYGIGASEGDLFEAHFDTEANRQLALGAQELAAAALLEGNLTAYEAFAANAQVEILLSALPAYSLELRKAELLLGHSDELVTKMQDILAVKRQRYMSRKSRNLGQIIRLVAVQIVDKVCAAYALPPLGSIVNQTFEGIKAAQDGDWSQAIGRLRNVAAMSGAEDWVKGQGEKVVRNILSSEKMKGFKKTFDELEEKKLFKELKKTVKESRLDEFATAKALSFINNKGKGFLPDDLIDNLVKPEDFQWAAGSDVETLAKEAVGTAAAKQGQVLLEQVARSGLSNSLKVLDDNSKLRSFVEKKLGVKAEGKFEFDKQVKKAADEVRDHVAGSVRTLIEDLKQPQKEQIARRQVESVVRKLRSDSQVTVSDPEF